MNGPVSLGRSEDRCRALMAKLDAARHWPGFRCWLKARSILRQGEAQDRLAIAIWLEDMIPEDSDTSALLEEAATGMVAELRAGQGGAFRLLGEEAFAAQGTMTAMRRDEVAGFLDGLLNNDQSLPVSMQFQDLIRRLEGVEEILDFIATPGSPALRVALLILDQLTQEVERCINRLAAMI